MRRVALLLAALAVLALAGVAHAATHVKLPLRDAHVTTAGPERGWAYACAKPAAAGKPPARPWIAGNTWDLGLRPTIDGSIAWPGAAFSLRADGSLRRFAGNAQPLRTFTGRFPVAAGDDALPYASSDAALTARSVTGSFRAKPVRRHRSSCLAANQPVAIALDGSPILAPFDAAGRDRGAREPTDACGGRTDATGLYGYPAGPRCLGRRGSGTVHSGQLGYARDGFRVYGPRGQGGKPLRSKDLDACHGHTHLLTINGKRRLVYHYHLTPDFPYALGCFRGRPSASWRIGQPVVPPKPPPLPPSPAPEVSADPALYPAFDPSVPDYVVRCQSGTPVNLSVSSQAPVSVDGGPAQAGDHSTPVALDSDQAFAFTWQANQGARTYHVRCLPPKFPGQWTTERSGTPEAEWYLLTPIGAPAAYVAIFDTNGVPVWWHTAPDAGIDAKLLPDGNLSWELFENAGGYRKSPGGALEIHRLDGSTVRTLTTVGNTTDFHDSQLLANGDFLLDTYQPRDNVDLSAHGGPAHATVVDGEIQEIDPNGNVVWFWNTKDHIGLDETDRWWPTVVGNPVTLPDGRLAYDIVHLNAVQPDGDGVVISLRHTDAVYRIDKATKDITWKLGGTTLPGLSLTPLNDPHADQPLGGQHDARILPDGTLTVHDNRTVEAGTPRAVRYRIDTTAHTATLLEQVTDTEPTSSFCCGSARKLPGGDWVISWGGTPYVAELSSTGQRVFRMTFPSGVQSYRANPILPGRLSRSALRAGMEVMHPRPH